LKFIKTKIVKPTLFYRLTSGVFFILPSFLNRDYLMFDCGGMAFSENQSEADRCHRPPRRPGPAHSLGVKSIIDSSKLAFEQDLPRVDVTLDTARSSTFQRCVAALKPAGKLVTSVSTQWLPAGAIFFYAEVTTARLQTLATLFEPGRITARVGSVLPLSEARQAQGCLRADHTSPARSSCRSDTRSSANLRGKTCSSPKR